MTANKKESPAMSRAQALRNLAKKLGTELKNLNGEQILAALAAQEKENDQNPTNSIPDKSESITPNMLPLINLTQVEIDLIGTSTYGGIANIKDIYPLAPLQENMLFPHRKKMRGDPFILHIGRIFDKRGDLDQFLGSMQIMIDRHDIFRTSILWEDLSQPVQVVCRTAKLPVTELNLDSKNGEIKAQLIAKVESSQFRMSLQSAPLFQLFVAFDKTTNEWLLMQVLHLMAIDVPCNLAQLAERELIHEGKPERLPTPVPYRNYISRILKESKKGEYESFFRNMLGDVTESTAPYGHLEVEGDGSKILFGKFLVDQDLPGRIRACSQKLGVSVACLWHIIFGRMLSVFSNREDVVFGTHFSVDRGEGSNFMMGPFIYLLPLRMKIGEESIESTAKVVQKTLHDLVGFDYVSLSKIQKCSGIKDSSPLFSAIFNYHQRPPKTQAELSKASKKKLFGLKEHTNYPLFISILDEIGENFKLEVMTHDSIQPERIIEILVYTMRNLVEAVETKPDMQFRKINVIP